MKTYKFRMKIITPDAVELTTNDPQLIAKCRLSCVTGLPISVEIPMPVVVEKFNTINPEG